MEELIFIIIALPIVVLVKLLSDIGSIFSEAQRASGGPATDSVMLGEFSGTWGVRQIYRIPRRSRLEHLSLIGATGSGKSTQAACYALQDAAAPSRPGLLMLDVKDTLVFSFAQHIPEHRLPDVLLFDAADHTYVPAFNPLASVPPSQRTLAVAEMVAALKRLFEASWGDRIEHVLRNTLLLLVETPEATLLDITRVMVEPNYRHWAITNHCSNFAVRGFFEHEFPTFLGRSGNLTNIQPVLTKLGILSAYPEIRGILGQTTRGLDLRAAMDQGKIILCHLPQGVLGEDASSFLAALIAGKAQLAGQSRVSLPPNRRRPFYIYADEFQLYETGAFMKMLTEGRSMGLGIVAANQFPEQLPLPLRLALEKNAHYQVRTNNATGAYTLDLVNLQLPVDDQNRVVPLIPLPPPNIGNPRALGLIYDQSRAALCQRREIVEAAIARRMGRVPTTAGSIAGAAANNSPKEAPRGHDFFDQ